MNKLKVCHISSVHPDNDVRILHKQCVSLAEAGYNTSLVLTNVKERLFNGVNIVSVSAQTGSRIRRMTETVNKALKKALEIDADIYHLHDPELLRIAPNLKRANKKVIYDVHEDLPRQLMSKKYINPGVKKILSYIIEKYEDKASSKLDYIITSTPHIRDRFLKFHPKTIDINNFPIIEELVLDYDYENKLEDNICYVGGLTSERGIKELTIALGLTEAKLLLAGKFTENGLKQKLSALDSWSQVEELGYINREEVKEVYKRSKLGLVTLHPIKNYLDSLAVKMFEYMAAGIPVIASNFPLWKSIIEKNNVGLCVDPMSPESIAEAITFLLKNKDKAREMGENGKRLVLEKYNWSIEKNKLLSIYNSLSS